MTKKYIKDAFLLLISLNLLFSDQALASKGQSVHTTMNKSHRVVKLSKQHFNSIWLRYRHTVNINDRSFVDTWLLQNQDLKVSDFQVSKFNCEQSEPCLRLLTKVGDEFLSIDLKNNEQTFAQINGVKISPLNSRIYGATLDKLTQQLSHRRKQRILLSKSPLIPHFRVFSQLTPKQRAHFIIQNRQLLKQAQRLQNSLSSYAQRQNSWQIMLLPMVFASFQNQKCLDSQGYVGRQQGASCLTTSAISCGDNLKSCNPALYGYERTSGKMICIEQSLSCDQASPLRDNNLKSDFEVLAGSFLKNQGVAESEIRTLLNKNPLSEKDYLRLKQIAFNDYEDYLNESTRLCEEQNKPSKECTALLQRRAMFNSYLVDLEARVEKIQPEDKDPVKSYAQTSQIREECGWWCRNKFWAYPTSIVGATFIGIFAVCKYTDYSLLNICGDKSNSDDGDDSTTTTDTLSLPTIDASADYSSGVK